MTQQVEEMSPSLLLSTLTVWWQSAKIGRERTHARHVSPLSRLHMLWAPGQQRRREGERWFAHRIGNPC